MDVNQVRFKYGTQVPIDGQIVVTEEVSVQLSDVATTLSTWLLNGWSLTTTIVTNMVTSKVSLFFTATILYASTAQAAVDNGKPLQFKGNDIYCDGVGNGIFLL